MRNADTEQGVTGVLRDLLHDRDLDALAIAIDPPAHLPTCPPAHRPNPPVRVRRQARPARRGRLPWPPVVNRDGGRPKARVKAVVKAAGEA
ncbi:hypothetical protein GCM10009577_31460 [Streptomyces javensis]